jgi:hypothetical protein
MGILGAAAISAIGAIGGGLISSGGASDAANAQQQSSQAAIAEQQREFDTTQANFAPYLKAGTGALSPLTTLLGLNGNGPLQTAIANLKNSPLYTSLFNTGNETILQDASATGGLRGGNTQRSLADFGSSLLSSVIQNQIGNLSGIAGMGEGATNQMAGFGQNNANAISSLLQSIGAARAGAATTNAGIWSGVTNNLAGMFGSPNFLSSLSGIFSGPNLGEIDPMGFAGGLTG